MYRLFAIALLLLPAQISAGESKRVTLSTQQINYIKAIVVRDFLDPDSAQFRNIRAVDWTKSNGKIVRRVCGEVNGKNAYGGYTGYSMFGGRMENGKFKQVDFFGPCE